MLKAKATGSDGKTIYIFGLSFENLKYLKEGKPISFNMSDLEGEGEIVIFSGETEETMRQEFSSMGMITKKTKFINQQDQN